MKGVCEPLFDQCCTERSTIPQVSGLILSGMVSLRASFILLSVLSAPESLVLICTSPQNVTAEVYGEFDFLSWLDRHRENGPEVWTVTTKGQNV